MNAHADCLYASSRSCSVGFLWLPIVTLSTGSFAALTVTGLSAFLIRTTQLRSERCGRLQSLHFIVLSFHTQFMLVPVADNSAALLATGC